MIAEWFSFVPERPMSVRVICTLHSISITLNDVWYFDLFARERVVVVHWLRDSSIAHRSNCIKLQMSMCLLLFLLKLRCFTLMTIKSHAHLFLSRANNFSPHHPNGLPLGEKATSIKCLFFFSLISLLASCIGIHLKMCFDAEFVILIDAKDIKWNHFNCWWIENPSAS